MISSSAHRVEGFSALNVDRIAGVPITRLPAGAAIGSDDLQRWSSNRSGGRSGAYTTRAERKLLDNWKTPTKEQFKRLP
jgi:hypothetical protein